MAEIVKQSIGIIKSFNPVKGYGFISCEDDLDLDIYFHFTQLLIEGKKEVAVGDKVEFLYKPFEDRGLRAYQIKLLESKE